VSEGLLLPPDRRLERLFEIMTLERRLLISLVALGGGAFLLLGAIVQWRAANFGDLDSRHTMRWVIPGATMAVLGFQTLLSSFFISMLRMRRTLRLGHTCRLLPRPT